MKVASSSTRAGSSARTRAPDVELFFKGDQPWARRGAEEWSLGDVHKDEMVFSPDGKRFAYVRQRAQASAGKGTAGRRTCWCATSPAIRSTTSRSIGRACPTS